MLTYPHPYPCSTILTAWWLIYLIILHIVLVSHAVWSALVHAAVWSHLAYWLTCVWPHLAYSFPLCQSTCHLHTTVSTWNHSIYILQWLHSIAASSNISKLVSDLHNLELNNKISIFRLMSLLIYVKYVQLTILYVYFYCYCNEALLHRMYISVWRHLLQMHI